MDKEFIDLSERERNEFLTKVNYAILRHPSCYMMAKSLVEFAERRGVFNKVQNGLEEVLNGLSKNKENERHI